ncbi:MAG: hypothetical protein WAN78_05855 [Methanoregula sp.]
MGEEERVTDSSAKPVQIVKTRLITALHSLASSSSISPIPPSIRSRETVATLSNFIADALLSPVPANEG